MPPKKKTDDFVGIAPHRPAQVVELWPEPDADHSESVLLEAERSDTDEVAIRLRGLAGEGASEGCTIYLSVAGAEALALELRRVARQPAVG